MKLLIPSIAIMLTLTGCGPHFLGKPEPFVEPTAKTSPQNVQLSIPNWPTYVYGVDGVIVVLIVRDPKSFPVPGAIRFTREDGTFVETPLALPEQSKDEKK